MKKETTIYKEEFAGRIRDRYTFEDSISDGFAKLPPKTTYIGYVLSLVYFSDEILSILAVRRRKEGSERKKGEE